MEGGPGEKCEKVTPKPAKEALEQPEQSRKQNQRKTEWKVGTKINKMDLSSKKALTEKAKKWMDPSSANYPKDNHTENKRAGLKMT